MEDIGNRYEVLDDYIVSEIKHVYKYGSSDEKISVLKEFYNFTNDNNHKVSYELARYFIENADEMTTLWLAKNGKDFDFSEKEYPDRDLWELFVNHKSDHIKSALYENVNYNGLSGQLLAPSLKDYNFVQMTQVQRLATIRCSLGYRLFSVALELFDENINLDFLSKEERGELQKALLTNRHFLEYTQDLAEDYDYCESTQDLGKLWRFISKNSDANVQLLAYQYLGAKDLEKCEIYSDLMEKCEPENKEMSIFSNYENNLLRQAIIEGSTIKDSKTLKLAISDPMPYIRKLALSKYIPEKKNGIFSYIKKYFLPVSYEIMVFLITVLLLEQFKSTPQLLLCCAILLSFFIVKYAVNHSFFSNAFQFHVTNKNILKINKSGVDEVERDIALGDYNINVMYVKTVIIEGAGTFIAMAYVFFVMIKNLIF